MLHRMCPDPEIIFQMLADSTRLRIVALLQGQGELCVCELTHTLSLSQPKISRHLGQLRESDLVEARRSGRWMYYRIREDLPAWTQSVLQSILEGVTKLSPYKEDMQSLEQMPDRPGASCCA